MYSKNRRNLNMFVFKLLLAVLPTFIGANEEQEVGPMTHHYRLAVLTTSDQKADLEDQAFHVYVTGHVDTDLVVRLPGTYLDKLAQLGEDNDWSWQETYQLSDHSQLKDAAWKTGFLVESSQPVIVMVYVESADGKMIAYAAFPVTDSDTEFVIGSYFSNDPNWAQTFLCVTGDQSTKVDVYTYQGQTGSAQDIYSNLVPPYTVLYVTGNRSSDLVGAFISTSHPVAAYGGHHGTMRLLGQHHEPILQQLPPASDITSTYVIGPFGSNQNNQYRFLVIFTEDGSSATIQYQEGVPVTSIGHKTCPCTQTPGTTGRCTIRCDRSRTRGQHSEFYVSDTTMPVSVRCSKPCLVFVLKLADTYSSQDKSGYMSLAPVPQAAPTPFHFFVPHLSDGHEKLQTCYVNIGVPRNGLAGILVDGIPFDMLQAFTQVRVEEAGDWEVAMLEMAVGNHRIEHKDNSVPLSLFMHGYVLDMSSFGIPINHPEGTKLKSGSPRNIKLSSSPGALIDIDDPVLFSVLVLMVVVLLLVVVILGFVVVFCRKRRTESPPARHENSYSPVPESAPGSSKPGELQYDKYGPSNRHEYGRYHSPARYQQHPTRQYPRGSMELPTIPQSSAASGDRTQSGPGGGGAYSDVGHML